MQLGVWLTVLSFVALSAPATAWDCQMATSDPEIDTGAHEGLPRYYADNDACPQFCGIVVSLLSWWVYQESNGIDGLQRQDEVHDDTCGGTAGVGDTIIY